MAAWTEAERAKLRHYMGFPSVFLQADPRFESVLDAVLAVADGGARPDASTQTQIQGWLSSLDSIESQLTQLWPQLAALQLSSLRIDPVRAVMALRSEGRRFVSYLSATFGVRPMRDVFAAPEYEPVRGPLDRPRDDC